MYECSTWITAGKALPQQLTERALIDWVRSISSPSEININLRLLDPYSTEPPKLSCELSVSWIGGQTGVALRLGVQEACSLLTALLSSPTPPIPGPTR
jgi:hypothetical protein